MAGDKPKVTLVFYYTYCLSLRGFKTNKRLNFKSTDPGGREDLNRRKMKAAGLLFAADRGTDADVQEFNNLSFPFF